MSAETLAKHGRGRPRLERRTVVVGSIRLTEQAYDAYAHESIDTGKSVRKLVQQTLEDHAPYLRKL